MKPPAAASIIGKVNSYEVLIGLAFGVVAVLGIGLSAYGWLESIRESRDEQRRSEYRRRLW